ncbi:GNAT family N-acetyltransferase [Pseudoalteromonas sp. MQS005]|uniref:GNAT family N-acetyltransferase n=1 Tax=Pseudoalteromonas sp. MQS005 TaxID=1854052 RepID=UPI0007E4F9AE|nr:GNAT family N-acetyltransferase [Pseudoalteromonas sp. MQS005]
MIILREAEQSDCTLLYQWVNDPVIRSCALKDAPITLQNHLTWFNKQLASLTSKIYIASIDDKPIGQVRFNQTALNTYEIDTHLSPCSRGYGYGREMLKQALKLIEKNKNSTFIATILIENIASIKLFEACNFKREKETTIKNKKCFIYIRKEALEGEH